MSNWQGLSSLLNDAMQRHGVLPAVDAIFILKTARDVLKNAFDSALAERVTPKWFKNQTLVISAKSAAGRSECVLRRENLRLAINEALKQEAIKTIVVILETENY